MTLDIAHILPTNCINKNMRRQKYELYLTQQVIQNPKTFEFLKDDEEPHYKILDNGACELGFGLDMSDVLEAAEIIGATEIVLPDIPRSSRSFALTLRGLSQLTTEQKDYYKIAAVVQGETLNDIEYSIRQLLSVSCIDTLMIPKWYCSLRSDGLGRHQIVSMIRKIEQEAETQPVDIHLLGLDVGIRELFGIDLKTVRSVDTGLFAAYCTPEWEHINALFDERPRNLKIDLNGMDVDIDRWNRLVDNIETIIGERNDVQD